LVSIGADGYRRLDYAKMTGYLVEVAKAQQQQIEELKSPTSNQTPASNLDTNLDTPAASTSASLADFDLLKSRVSGLEDLLPSAFSLSGSYLDSETNLSPLPPAGLSLDGSNETHVAYETNVTHVLSDMTVGGSLTVGLITIDDMNASINSMGDTLKIQNQSLADIEFLGGKIIMTKTGDVEIYGSLAVEGTVTATAVEAGEFKVLGASSAGSSMIEVGETAVTVPAVSAAQSSRILLTPTTLTDQVLTVTAKSAGEFRVEIAEPAETDIKFDWFIVGN